MAKLDWKILFGSGLLAVSLTFFGLDLFLFRDLEALSEHLIFYLGLIPLEVIVVTLVLDQLMEARERRERLEKMNMVIGLFFSELGTDLLRLVVSKDPAAGEVRTSLQVSGKWKTEDFARVEQILKTHLFSVQLNTAELAAIKDLVSCKRSLLVQLLENPILLEHEKFTNLLRAVFHLAEELDYRRDLTSLPQPDLAHLSGDTSRAYDLLAREWLVYVKYLESHYPFLFSLAIRTNPFDENATPVIQQ